MSDLIIKPSGTSANFKVQNPSGTDKIVMNSSGTITTATLGSSVTNNAGVASGTIASGVTNNAGVASGTIASGVTIASGINMPDFDLNLSSGQNRIVTFGSTGFQIWGVLDSTGTGNSSARTGIFGSSSSSGSFKTEFIRGYVSKTGTRADLASVKSQNNTLTVIDRVQGYVQGPSVNAVGEGTLSPSGARWSLQFNSAEDYELQLASADGGTFYYYFFGHKV